MLPVLVITWLRQLQRFFREEENHTWSKHGNYIAHDRLTPGESKNPLGIVYLKSTAGHMYKVKNYFNIKPDETYNRENKVCTSLEEWAMDILKPPIQKRLDQAISSNT
jgi:hypothetical protein